MTAHQISNADEIFYGRSGYAPGIGYWGRDGMKMTGYFRYNWGNVAPLTADTAYAMTAQTFTAAGAVTFDTHATGGVVTFDVARNVTFNTTTGVNLTGKTLSIAGTDLYGAVLSEHIIGPNGSLSPGVGSKMFKTLTSASVSSSISVGVSIGMGTKLGLPFAYTGKRDVLAFYVDDTADLSSATFTGAVTTDPATVSTGDVRGSVTPSVVPNGSRKYTITFAPIDVDTRTDLYGVAQA